MKEGRGFVSLVLLTLVSVACSGGSGQPSGADLAEEVGCFACHGETDTEVGPTLEGIWGTSVLLEDGRTVVVDEAYVRRAITDPQADIAAGYIRRMPDFGLSETEVDTLVDYVRSLG